MNSVFKAMHKENTDFLMFETTVAGKKVIAIYFCQNFHVQYLFLLNTFWFLLKDILYLKQDEFFSTFQVCVNMVALVLIFALMPSCTDGLCKCESVCVCMRARVFFLCIAKKINIYGVNSKDYIIYLS